MPADGETSPPHPEPPDPPLSTTPGHARLSHRPSLFLITEYHLTLAAGSGGAMTKRGERGVG
ncbi:MAG: hypothetical protein AVDCRST_MAG22-2314 [uncultured Rubrobacteraceae bacterium]|uniref:Uncharacterized protein n=1 Tax=uncultured Rubrobacteraceae bacterium TaxID=349277 RepID=A0A6J4PJT7_9ACTN|nr:MAG: hypothetical protein AVDCRST_MAG22-2314 [uncultured Rubrobacteraceae bacterium]